MLFALTIVLVASGPELLAAKPMTVVTIDPKHRLIEGVATDGKTIFVTSVLDRQVLACTRACRTIATLPEGLHPLGIAFDWGRKLLWIAADCPKVADIGPCERGALIAINRNGKPHGRFVTKEGPFHPGDVFASQGGIFVSDSQSGLVWSLLPRKPGLRVANGLGQGKSAQGIALAPTGVELVIADYALGIGRVSLKTGATSWLPRQDGKPSVGIDGLVRCGSSYLGVYNGGAAPARIWRIRMRTGSIERTEFVDGLTLTDPTQIAFDGKRLLAVVDSGWERLGREEEARRTGARILAIPLGKDCTPL